MSIEKDTTCSAIPETFSDFEDALFIDVSFDTNNGVFRRYPVQNNPVNWIDPFGLAPNQCIFSSADEAALDATAFYIKRSNKENREYGCFIYENKKGKYCYTKAVPGDCCSHDVSKFNRPPQEDTIEAIYHTHPGGDTYQTREFSTRDELEAGPLGRHMDMYLGNQFETKAYNSWNGARTITRMK